MADNIVARVLACAPRIAAEIAGLLLSCEILQKGERRSIQEEDVSKAFEADGPGTVSLDVLCATYPFLPPRDELQSRLLRTVWKAWTSLVAIDSDRRPDVLRLTAQVLATPRVPHAARIVRFALILGLRTKWQVNFNTECVEKLSDILATLKGLYEGQSTPQKGGTPRSVADLEPFVLDVLALEGFIYRSLGKRDLEPFYQSFRRYDYGVLPGIPRRAFLPSSPEFHGAIPDFPTLLNFVFGQPVAVRGFDEVTGGLIPSLPNTDGNTSPGGQVTLIYGAAGTGKTSLCLNIAARTAELGGVVRYLTTEEDPAALMLKLTAIGGQRALSKALWPRAPLESVDLEFIDGQEFTSLKGIAEKIATDLSVRTGGEGTNVVDTTLVYLTFPQALIVDSLGGLLGNEQARQHLSDALASLRRSGVCVFLVGGVNEPYDDLEYLVDNVFVLGTEQESAEFDYPTRTMNVLKTRLQASHRGRHVLSLSRRHGCYLSPSLHSVIRELEFRPGLGSSDSKRAALLCTESQSELTFAGEDRAGPPLRLFSQSQCLVWGIGSAGKASLALAIAFEAFLPVEPEDRWKAYVQSFPNFSADIATLRKNLVNESRVLVLSFFYDRAYYCRLLRDVIEERFGCATSNEWHREHIKVLQFHPGLLEPETLVSDLMETLAGAELEGRPFSGVVVDGIHNTLLQFPRFERAKLLWPAVYRILRNTGVTVVSTFTREESMYPREASDLLFTLLASGSDYTFQVKLDGGHYRVTVQNTPERSAPTTYPWNPRTMEIGVREPYGTVRPPLR